jgi:Transmembrane amino acid transporter protein
MPLVQRGQPLGMLSYLSLSTQSNRCRGAVFYLITTDILGPFSTGYAFSQMGLGPGVALFTVFGGLGVYTGYQLWRMYIQLDSDRYPMKGYGDIAFRVYGTWFRHTFIVCVMVCAVAGCLIGQIRTLQRLGWLASSAVFINLFVIFAT